MTKRLPRAGIPEHESLTIEFKSDRNRLADADLIAATVCLANTEGGTLFVGVEDDGEITGLLPVHQDLPGMAALIANRTRPPLNVQVTRLEVDGKVVARIEVPKARNVVATADGLVQHRRLRADGTPECVPMYPHEVDRRFSDLSLLDYSARVIPDTSIEDFDSLERQRLRRAILQYGGDRALLPLPDAEFDSALGFTRQRDGKMLPTITGLLLLGREQSLREHIPTHEIAFQMLDGTEVRVNEFYHSPLLDVLERIWQQFEARVDQREIQVGLFRVPVPTYAPSAFREALANAIIHRDYTRLGAIHVRWLPDGIEISNPGGFVEGVTLANLLVTEPRPRNPLLADAFKRLGLVERTGRGVDIIFEGLLRYGRQPPDYRRSDSSTVVVRLPGGEANLAFVELIHAEERRLGRFSLDALLALNAFRENGQLTPGTLAQITQKDEAAARQVLERLVDAGLAEPRGSRRGRVYHLSAAVYRRLGQPAAYVRQRGFDSIQQEQMVLQYAQGHGRITRREAADLCRLKPRQATYLLDRLVRTGQLVRHGSRRATYYERPS